MTNEIEEPMLVRDMRRRPYHHVEVVDPMGVLGKTGTSCRGFVAEYDEAIRQAKAQALREAAKPTDKCRYGLDHLHEMLIQPGGLTGLERTRAKELTFNCLYAGTLCGWMPGQ